MDSSSHVHGAIKRASVADRCRQILWKLSAFQKAEEIPDEARQSHGLAFEPGETLLGRYLHRDCTIVFWLSDQALYLPRAYGVPKRRALAEIKSIKRDIPALLLIADDGSSDRLVISGGKSRTRHLFQVLRFFERVAEDRA